MKMQKSKNFQKMIGLLAAAILICTGCTSKITCRDSHCDREATRECYNMNDSKDVEYYCDIHCPSCYICRLYNPLSPDDAVRFEVRGVYAYYCEVHNRGDNPVSGGIVG